LTSFINCYNSVCLRCQDAENRTALHAAAFSGCTEIIELLLKHGARVNAKDNLCLTALHRACRQDHKVGIYLFVVVAVSFIYLYLWHTSTKLVQESFIL